jgi:hypothetical protein
MTLLRSPAVPGPPVAAVAGVAAVLAGAFTGYLVHTVVTDRLQSDFRAHLQFAATGLQHEPVPGNFLLYLLIGIGSGFSAAPHRLLAALVVVLVLATVAKAWLSVAFVAGRRPVPVWALVAAALCLLAFSPPVPDAYLGQIPANVWHNSTTMLLMPFAIGMFWTSYEYLRTGSRRMLGATLALAALNVAAKPSFVFCFLVVFPLAVRLVRRDRREVRAGWLVTAGAAAFLAAQYVYIFVAQLGGAAAEPQDRKDGIAVDPFAVWSAFSDNIPVSLLVSYAFPITALLFGGALVRRDLAVRYAGALAATGLLIFVVLKESGPRELHGNFLWQAVVTNYLLFLALVGAAVPWLRQTRFGWRPALVTAAFLLHVVCGVLYLHHYLTSGRFL